MTLFIVSAITSLLSSDRPSTTLTNNTSRQELFSSVFTPEPIISKASKNNSRSTGVSILVISAILALAVLLLGLTRNITNAVQLPGNEFQTTERLRDEFTLLAINSSNAEVYLRQINGRLTIGQQTTASCQLELSYYVGYGECPGLIPAILYAGNDGIYASHNAPGEQQIYIKGGNGVFADALFYSAPGCPLPLSPSSTTSESLMAIFTFRAAVSMPALSGHLLNIKSSLSPLKSSLYPIAALALSF